MAKRDYTSKDIKVLDEVEHIRLAPGMYIGDTSNPVHLVEEALDNALDECLAGHATIVAVNIDTKTNTYCILDNGRGIPIDNDTPITISSKLFSGAKFQDSKSTYLICSGLHGVGLVALNALSSLYIIEIYRDGKHAKYVFENAKLKEKKIQSFNDKAPFSTKIQFKPDKKIFESMVPDINRIRKRLAIASVELNKVTLVLNVDSNKEIFTLNSLGYFQQECLNDSDTETTKIIDISVSDTIESMHVKFCYSLNGTIAPRTLSSVNLLPVDSGGTHVNLFLDILKDLFTARAKKIGLKFQPYDALCGLRSHITLKLQKPEFSGQTKDKLINRKESLSKLSSKLKAAIDEYFSKDPEELDRLVNQFAEYRKKLDSKKLKAAGNGKRASTRFTKLRDCTSTNGELFITEGDSAGGSLLQCRDPRLHAVLPLKGKIPSIVNAKEILKNQEIGELIQALGTGVGPHFDVTKLKYNKVICAADADFDGYHIFCLLTILLAVLVPDIVKNGNYYLAQTPLYAINKGKTFIPLWTNDELEKAKKKGEPITRFKGLGELSPWQLKICLLDNNTRHLTKVKYSKNIDEMLKLFSDVNEKRKLLADDSIGEVEI